MKKALIVALLVSLSSRLRSRSYAGQAVVIFLLLASVVWCPVSAFASDIFVGSDTYVVTNLATSVIAVDVSATSLGTIYAWHPAGILANFRDSPTGAVLTVQHIRAGVVNRLVNTTNTISVTNTVYTSSTGVVSAIVWDPDGVYTVNPTNDSLRITTSSTNAEIILNKAIQR